MQVCGVEEAPFVGEVKPQMLKSSYCGVLPRGCQKGGKENGVRKAKNKKIKK